MRKFHSYGPVKSKMHFYVPRDELVKTCVQSLIGDPDISGHYFTIWAPRQTGKTWLVERSVQTIRQQYSSKFYTAYLSMQGFIDDKRDDNVERFLNYWPRLIEDEFGIKTKSINSWEKWLDLFTKQRGIFDKPVIMLIDEFDKLPPELINQTVSLFREMYLKPDNYNLHGLALVGVRSVLGVDNERGSPFNVQRSLHIPNLTFDEVISMFDQYQQEYKQVIQPQVIQKLYEKTNGQPGLIGWFGELLTEKYNQDVNQLIDLKHFDRVYLDACEIEHNNTVRNMITKAKKDYQSYALKLFTNANIRFSFDYDWCNYMYMHGIISYEKIEEKNKYYHVCRFSSPFIQTRLFNAFAGEISEAHENAILPLEPLDTLDDVVCESGLNLPSLLNRYKKYLARLKENGINPWKNQPRRKQDFHLTEAVGHFHLYHWLHMALGIQSIISPEFPTGNGKVDLHVEYEDRKGIIEVKSFTNAKDAILARTQAAKYARQTGYPSVTIAIFVPFTDETVLDQISVTETINEIIVNVVAIGQG